MSASAKAIFGKSGAELLSVFSDGNFGEAAAQVGGQAQILQRDSALPARLVLLDESAA